MRFVLPILALAFMTGCGDKDEDSAATTDSDAVDCIKDKSDCDQQLNLFPQGGTGNRCLIMGRQLSWQSKRLLIFRPSVRIRDDPFHNAPQLSWLEQRTVNPRVPGSSPGGAAFNKEQREIYERCYGYFTYWFGRFN